MKTSIYPLFEDKNFSVLALNMEATDKAIKGFHWDLSYNTKDGFLSDITSNYAVPDGESGKMSIQFSVGIHHIGLKADYFDNEEEIVVVEAAVFPQKVIYIKEIES